MSVDACYASRKDFIDRFAVQVTWGENMVYPSSFLVMLKLNACRLLHSGSHWSMLSSTQNLSLFISTQATAPP
jgi:hypothetical protein